MTQSFWFSKEQAHRKSIDKSYIMKNEEEQEQEDNIPSEFV